MLEASDKIRIPEEQRYLVLTDWSLAPKVLNIQEASLLTQVPIKTLYKWSSEGKLLGITRTIGKQLRFDRDALLDIWVNGKKKTTK